MSANQTTDKPQVRFGRLLFYAAGPLLVAYLLLLLGTTYTAQQDLREATLNELKLNLDKRASALSYFHTERMADIINLTGDQALSVYFSNQALGMSMEYGLRASLVNMQKRFEQLTTQKKLDSAPVYLRLMFLDTDNNRLVDVGRKQGRSEHWDNKWIDGLKTAKHTIIQDDDHFHMALLVPYFYKGNRVGAIIAEINHQAVFNKLINQQDENDPSYVLLSKHPAVLSPSNDGDTQRISDTQTNWSYPRIDIDDVTAYVKITVPDTPFLLAALHPRNKKDTYWVESPWYLFSLALMALFVLFTVVIGFRTQSHNLVLTAKFDASKRHGKLLHRQNKLLEMEIQKRHESEHKLAHQANYDPLTELPNRTLAMDRLSQALERAKRQDQFVVGMFIDLDHFKKVNDTLGHDAGDLLLKQAAHRLQHSIRSSDTAARLGGDEFMIILPDVQDINTAEAICEKIMHNFSSPFRVQNQEFNISASIGIALGPKNGADAQALMKSADLALYKAKEAGRDCFRFYTREMNRHAKRRQAVETQLIRAVEKDEFHLHFQPMIDLRDKHIVGTEALIRWSNATLGEVSPANFIPLAEESGLILDIGDWVIQQALQTIVGLGPAAAHLRVAVNVSCRQLLKPKHFLSVIEDALNTNNFPPNQLDIEITERLLLEDRKEILRLLHDLTELGVRLVVDDFGTGFSSLSYLKKFPLDVLKIDQSFIRDVLIDKNDASLTKAIIAIAHELDLEAVGEGVETEAQAKFLMQAKCDIAQGYLFGRPADASTLWNLLTDNSEQKKRTPGLV
ncbi:MAG: EAL domain-containing protein [Pseudomonadota bacterium]